MAQHKLPRHVAIIMDGNGRWAAARGLPRLFGHRAGADAVRRVVEAACELEVEALTLYAFSWENWERPSEEIKDLMALLEEFLDGETPRMLREQIRLQAIGRLEHLPPGTRGALDRLIAATAAHRRMTLTLALSYGGRQEIVDAVRKIADAAAHGRLKPEAVDEAAIAAHLYTAGQPDPDLVIRTSGERRLSNFLLWQSSYAELYVTPKLWPEFGKEDLTEAIEEFKRRERRFGRSPAHV